MSPVMDDSAASHEIWSPQQVTRLPLVYDLYVTREIETSLDPHLQYWKMRLAQLIIQTNIKRDRKCSVSVCSTVSYVVATLDGERLLW